MQQQLSCYLSRLLFARTMTFAFWKISQSQEREHIHLKVNSSIGVRMNAFLHHRTLIGLCVLCQLTQDSSCGA